MINRPLNERPLRATHLRFYAFTYPFGKMKSCQNANVRLLRSVGKALGQFQVVPVCDAGARDVPYAQIYFRVHIYARARTFRLSVCLHAPVTIYAHLERSARIDRDDAPGTRA